jgi:hypothetical protein
VAGKKLDMAELAAEVAGSVTPLSFTTDTPRTPFQTVTESVPSLDEEASPAPATEERPVPAKTRAPRATRRPTAKPANPAARQTVGEARWDRRDVRFWPDQADSVDLLVKRLNRARGKGNGDPITPSMLIRVATTLLLDHSGRLTGAGEAEVLDSLREAVAAAVLRDTLDQIKREGIREIDVLDWLRQQARGD